MRDDNVAVVTGGTRGIGAGLVSAFREAGLHVETFGSATVDVADAAAVEAFAASVAREHGGIDLWVNNAGVLEPIGMFTELEPAAVERHMAVNVLGVMNGARAFFRHAREDGTLVNISSGAAVRPYAGWSLYCAAKAAVDQFTRVLVEEGHRAFALAPGVVDTDMQKLVRAQDPARFPAVAKFHKLKADDAFLTPDKSARVILALAFGEAGATSEPVLDVRDAKWADT